MCEQRDSVTRNRQRLNGVSRTWLDGSVYARPVAAEQTHGRAAQSGVSARPTASEGVLG